MDCGTSWDTLTGLTGDSTIYAIAIHPTDPDIVYACKTNGIFKSTNGGGSWINTGLTNVNSIVIDPSAPETVYAGTPAGVYKSSSGGGSWQPMNEGIDIPIITDLGVDIDRNLYASTKGSGIYRWQINTDVTEKKYSGQHSISSVHPNPGRGNFQIDYTINDQSTVTLCIYDTQGRLIRTLIQNEVKPPGAYTEIWNGLDENAKRLPVGIYFYKLSTARSTSVEKVVLIE